MLDERQRMAGEIHDVLAQGLTGIVTQLEAADQAAGRPADWRRHLGQAKQLARDSLTEARRSVQALSPQPLAEAGLPDALADVVDGWSTMNGVTAELITTGTAQPLLPEIETTLLRTAQEALANVARHAGASRVALTLSYMEDLVTLDVRDDGSRLRSGRPPPGRRGRRLRAGRDARTGAPHRRHPGGRVRTGQRNRDLGLRTGHLAARGGGVIRLLIVDDHPVVRDGLRGMFAGDDRFEVVGEAGNGHEALAVARSVRPDVVLMDLRMPGMDGVTTIRELKEQGSAARVLVLTTYDTDSDVLPAIKAGRDRLPAQGHPARGAVPGRRGGPPRRVGAVAVGGRPADGQPALTRPGAAEPARARGLAADRPGLQQPGDRHQAVHLARPRSKPTSSTCTRNWASATEPPPWQRPSNAASYTPPTNHPSPPRRPGPAASSRPRSRPGPAPGPAPLPARPRPPIATRLALPARPPSP